MAKVTIIPNNMDRIIAEYPVLSINYLSERAKRYANDHNKGRKLLGEVKIDFGNSTSLRNRISPENDQGRGGFRLKTHVVNCKISHQQLLILVAPCHWRLIHIKSNQLKSN